MKNFRLFDETNLKYINGAILVAANLLYFFLACSQVFCYDESYTIGMISREFSEIIDITANDVHSPLYYMVLRVFYLFPGMESLASTRIFSWIFMSLYLLAGSFICRRVYNRKVEFYWLLLSAFMPAMIMQSTNVRMYAMGLFFVTTASYLAYSLYKYESRQKWILFTVFSLIAVYIHTFCMIEMVVVYGLFVVAVLREKNYLKLRKILCSGVAVSVGFLPWLIVLYHQFRRWSGAEEGWGSHIESVSWETIKEYMAEWFSSLENPNSYVIGFSLLLIGIAAVYCIGYVRKSKNMFPLMGVLVAGVTFTVAMLVSVCIVPCFMGRYLFPVFGGIWLFVAVGMSRIKQIWVKIPLVVGILLCSLVTVQSEMQLRDEDGLKAYLEYMNEDLEEDDVIMCDTFFASMMNIFYPQIEYMVYGWMPEGLPFDNTTVFTDYEQLEGVDTVWYISLEMRYGNLDQEYTAVERIEIPYSYYNIILEKYERM